MASIGWGEKSTASRFSIVFSNYWEIKTPRLSNQANIKIPGLEARDGLSIINGSNLLTAMSAFFCYDIISLIKHAEVAASMSLDALICY